MCSSIFGKIQTFSNWVVKPIIPICAIAGIGHSLYVAKNLYSGESLDEKVQKLFMATLLCDTSMYVAANVLSKRSYLKTMIAFSAAAVLKQVYLAFSPTTSLECYSDSTTKSALYAMMYFGTVSGLQMANAGLQLSLLFLELDSELDSLSHTKCIL